MGVYLEIKVSILGILRTFVKTIFTDERNQQSTSLSHPV
jgi:hypothetical protein